MIGRFLRHRGGLERRLIVLEGTNKILQSDADKLLKRLEQEKAYGESLNRYIGALEGKAKMLEGEVWELRERVKKLSAYKESKRKGGAG